MRVVAGSAGRLPLEAPRSNTLRPTMDKVRAAIFDSLGPAVATAAVLDLYAGTGSLGIEALSRGAAAATFVESDRAAAECIRRNLARTGLADRGHVVTRPVDRFLAQAADADVRFDFVFADPPYLSEGGHPEARALLDHPALPGLLGEDALVVLEVPRRFDAAPHTERWQIGRDRSYGRSRILFLMAADTGGTP